MNRRVVWIASSVLLCAALVARAELYSVGSTLPALQLPDQHGEARTLENTTRALVFSRDMSAGRIVKEAVAKAGNDLFDRNHAVYVVDLAGMPGMIRSMFAMPGLRRRPYKLMVDEEGKATTDFPSQEEHPTVLILKERKVERVEYPADADALIKLLEPPATP